MPRKRKPQADDAEPLQPVVETPEGIGHTLPEGPVIRPKGVLGQGKDEADQEGKNWGDPYKALVTTASFEMGENRRFKQRVFLFKEKPLEEVLAALKDNGFTYRANEKAWTIQATPDSRRLSDELAREFAGQAVGVSR
jgi:hypothetical protein